MGIQGKLLRVLQERTIRRVGGEKSTPVDIRVIAATNRDLVCMVKEGNFRSDLYFRINVLGLKIPPLRERRDDIVPLAEEFLAEASVRNHRVYYFSEEAEDLLREYSWPGNIRELQNMVRRLTVISDEEEIGGGLIRDYIAENRRLTEPEEDSGGACHQNSRKEKSCPADILDSRTSYTLEEALAVTGNNRKKAAELMGVSRATFYRMLEREAAAGKNIGVTEP